MNEKKMIGFSLLGIIKNGEPWKKAHEIGMKELAERSGVVELIEKSQDDEDYFDFVKKALGKIDEYKDLEEGERIARRRGQYFDNVLRVLREGDYIDEGFVEALKVVKEDYDIALITTNTAEFVREVLKIAGCEGMFDKVVTLDSSEEDDKKLVFERALDEIGKIDLFIGSEKSGKICDELGIKFLLVEDCEKIILHDIIVLELEREAEDEYG